MMTNRFAVMAVTPIKIAVADEIAQKINIPLISALTPEAINRYDYIVVVTHTFIGIQKTTSPFSPYYIDYANKKMHYRIHHASLRNEALARAIGLNPKASTYHIMDATAGMGYDSFLLASLGYRVTMFERSPIIHTLLADALLRASHLEAFKKITERIELVQGDSVLSQEQWIKKPPNVIYVDPMFPPRHKSALAKKEMQLLQGILAGSVENDVLLFEMALSCATHRVVVKRPRLGIPITERKPNFTLIGKASRFDVYMPVNMSAEIQRP